MSLCFGCTGFLVLFFNEWEQMQTETDLEFQLRNQLPLIVPPVNALRFTELVFG